MKKAFHCCLLALAMLSLSHFHSHSHSNPSLLHSLSHTLTHSHSLALSPCCVRSPLAVWKGTRVCVCVCLCVCFFSGFFLRCVAADKNIFAWVENFNDFHFPSVWNEPRNQTKRTRAHKPQQERKPRNNTATTTTTTSRITYTINTPPPTQLTDRSALNTCTYIVSYKQ